MGSLQLERVLVTILEGYSFLWANSAWVHETEVFNDVKRKCCTTPLHQQTNI
jgi:hypothetical protein